MARSSTLGADNRYHQVAVFPGETARRFTGRMGVVPFDDAVFTALRRRRRTASFLDYLRYYVSDHRPLWVELDSR